MYACAFARVKKERGIRAKRDKIQKKNVEGGNNEHPIDAKDKVTCCTRRFPPSSMQIIRSIALHATTSRLLQINFLTHKAAAPDWAIVSCILIMALRAICRALSPDTSASTSIYDLMARVRMELRMRRACTKVATFVQAPPAQR